MQATPSKQSLATTPGAAQTSQDLENGEEEQAPIPLADIVTVKTCQVSIGLFKGLSGGR